MHERLEAWKRSGAGREVFGRRLFYHRLGPEDGETVLVLHGFPTSSYDFAPVLPGLAQRRQVVAHDHLGFGFSDKPVDFSYSRGVRGVAGGREEVTLVAKQPGRPLRIHPFDPSLRGSRGVNPLFPPYTKRTQPGLHQQGRGTRPAGE